MWYTGVQQRSSLLQSLMCTYIYHYRIIPTTTIPRVIKIYYYTDYAYHNIRFVYRIIWYSVVLFRSLYIYHGLYGHIIGSLAFYDETMRLMCVTYMYYRPCAYGDLVKKKKNWNSKPWAGICRGKKLRPPIKILNVNAIAMKVTCADVHEPIIINTRISKIKPKTFLWIVLRYIYSDCDHFYRFTYRQRRQTINIVI